MAAVKINNYRDKKQCQVIVLLVADEMNLASITIFDMMLMQFFKYAPIHLIIMLAFSLSPTPFLVNNQSVIGENPSNRY